MSQHQFHETALDIALRDIFMRCFFYNALCRRLHQLLRTFEQRLGLNISSQA